jgi:hypothetical protein
VNGSKVFTKQLSTFRARRCQDRILNDPSRFWDLFPEHEVPIAAVRFLVYQHQTVKSEQSSLG